MCVEFISSWACQATHWRFWHEYECIEIETEPQYELPVHVASQLLFKQLGNVILFKFIPFLGVHEFGILCIFMHGTSNMVFATKNKKFKRFIVNL